MEIESEIGIVDLGICNYNWSLGIRIGSWDLELGLSLGIGTGIGDLDWDWTLILGNDIWDGGMGYRTED